jgi:uncharacterized protein YbjT (DUF2867 family)
MVRASSDECRNRWPGAEVVVADALSADSLREALHGIHAAYYLIHSLLLGQEEFESKEIQAAENLHGAEEGRPSFTWARWEMFAGLYRLT